jgi:glycosyltransferase involved in cell wall biosynthesis
VKVLVVTALPAPWASAEQNGIARRFGGFLRALHRVSQDITLLHIVSEAVRAAAGPLDELSRSQSDYWRVPVHVALAPRRTRTETRWNHYGAGILDASAQPAWFPYGGADLAAAVGSHLDETPDLVFAHRLPAMLPLLQCGRRLPPVILDMDDIEHRVCVRRTFSKPFYLGKQAQLLQVPVLFRLERQAVAASRLALVCSETDRAYLRRLGFGSAVQVVPNSLPVPAAPPGLVREPTVLFLGDMQYGPNRVAAERMAREIWPLVRARVPDARLLVAGRESKLVAGGGAGLPGVELLGFVPDLDGLYARSRVVCCPITVGGGTRLKLIEAAAYARPIVSTRLGAEGLSLADGREALLRDDNAGFAAACATLLRDDALCLRLGGAARAVMTAAYDVQQVEDRIASMVLQATGQKTAVQRQVFSRDTQVLAGANALPL